MGYEVVQVFGNLFILFCAIIGAVTIADTMLKKSFLPACRSIKKSLKRMFAGDRITVSGGKHFPIKIADVDLIRKTGTGR